MRSSPWVKYVLTFAVAATIGFLLTAAPNAQRRRGGDNNSGLPVATNMILTNPSAYAGKEVSVSAGIVEVVSNTAFMVDQRTMDGPTAVKAMGAQLLVLAPYLAGAPDQEHYLLMKGRVATLDLANMPSGYALDVAPALRAKYQGQPVLLASSILTSTYKELVLKPLLPPGPEELVLMAAMKVIGPASTALRAAVQESNKAVITDSIAKLAPAFRQTEKAWEDLGQTPPAQWARDAKDFLAVIERETSADNWEAVKLSGGNLTAMCATCHGAYRERQPDGTFRIKPGSY